MSQDERAGLRARSEEAIGELAQALVENPVFNRALGQALGAGERAMAAQRTAMRAANFASGSDLQRVEHRLRSISTRLEGLEDSVDRLADELSALRRQVESQPGPPQPD